MGPDGERYDAVLSVPRAVLGRRGRAGLVALFGLLGLFALDQGFYRADQHVGVAALHARHAFHRAVGGKVGAEAHKELLAEVGVGNFTTSVRSEEHTSEL